MEINLLGSELLPSKKQIILRPWDSAILLLEKNEWCWLLVLALSSVGSWLHLSSQIPVTLSRGDAGSVLACGVIMKNFNQAVIRSCSSTEAVRHIQQ